MSEKKYPSSLQLWSICLGNFFEHYDTALFGFLSVFFAPLFFPEHDLITALILTYALIPLAMLARPIGALVFGMIGDVYGRKQALFLSLGGMSLITGCIAFCPTYNQVGVIAPLFFCCARLMQNFFSSGETMGGAIFLLEHTSEKYHNLLSGFYNATTIGGILFASIGVSLLSFYDFVDWGWRGLYILGCLTALFGLMIRKQFPAEVWECRSENSDKSILSLIKILWIHRRALGAIMINSGFSYANYSIALILMNGFVPLVSSVTKEDMMALNTFLLVVDFCALPFFGWLSSKFSREMIMFSGALGVIVFGVPLFMLIPESSLTGIIAIRISLVLFGVAFCAPFHAWAQQLVPKIHRYTVISFGYALGSQLLGGPTLMVSLWMFKRTEMISSVVWYWLILATLSSVVTVLSLKSTQKSCESN